MEKIKYNSLTLVPNENGTAYLISECDKNVTSITVPARVNGLFIEEILENAFENCKALKSVTFELADNESIEKDEYLRIIGAYAFSGCVALEKIDLPNYVETIDRGAFYECKELKSVTFGKYVYVAPFAFYGCESLKECTPVGETVSEGVFSQCKSLEYLPIDERTSEIGEEAFAHCYSLVNVTLPKSLGRIEALAFRSCYELKSVTFENTSNWYSKNCYFDKERELNLTDPILNAKALCTMDFDDGVIDWYVKK